MLLIDISDWPNIENMLTHFSAMIPELNKFIVAVAFMVGVFYTFRAIYQLKEYGELRAMMSMQTDMRRPLIMFAVSAMLLYVPTVYEFSMTTIFGTGSASPLAYVSSSTYAWSHLESIVVKIIQLVGLIAFIRGIMILATFAGAQHPPGTLGKALTHLIGGIFALNIVGTMNVMEQSFDFFTS